MSNRRTGECRPAAPPDGKLFQAALVDDPFWMMVACTLVNLTTWRQAKPAFEWLRRSYGTAAALATARPEELVDAMRPLGLWRRRTTMLPRMADAWLRARPRTAEEVLGLPGCGRYASDSWAIFVEGRRDVSPSDGKLAWYLEQLGG